MKYVVASFLLLALFGCGYTVPNVPDISPRKPDYISLQPRDWYVLYSVGTAPHPSAAAEGAWFFDFPSDPGHVNYVQTPFHATVPHQSLTVIFKIVGTDPQFHVMDPADHPPATVHIFFEQVGDDLGSDYGRWWADTGGYDLQLNGDVIAITVPLDPSVWSSVFGHRNDQAFQAALANVGWVGFTFGGQSFWGHGVGLADGAATFTLIDFRVD